MMNKYLGNSLDTILSSFLCRNYDSKNKFDHEIRDNSDSTITFETEYKSCSASPKNQH